MCILICWNPSRGAGKNEKKGVFTLVIVTLLIITSIPLISVGSEGEVIGNSSKEAYYSDFAEEEKRYCNATLEDNFADNGVLIVLNKETSMSFKTYTPKDFAETGCKNVAELSKEYSAYAKKQFDSKTIQMQNVSRMDVTLSNGMKSEADEYRTILYLELAESGKENVLAAIKKLEERDDILSAEPDYICSVFATPNDPLLGNQWAINNIGLPSAWDITKGSSTVTVGVLDTGIEGTHPDLTNRINKSLCRDFTSGAMVVVTNPTDLHGHGTHVAGIIGAQGNNGTGVAGTCWDVRMVSLRVFDAQGNGTISAQILAVDFARGQNIQILNLSGGGELYSSALEQSIKSYNGLFVCAAGNDNRDNDGSKKIYPASLRLPNLISVGATNQSNAKAVPGDPGWLGGSNYGAKTVDVFAPGTYILSTYKGGQYLYASGTSMAAPYVAGVAALLLTKNVCSPSGLKDLIMNNVDTSNALKGLCVSGGKINAQKAVNANLFGGGNGTSSNPYQISTVQQLKNTHIYGTISAHYKLMANLTLSGNWTPIKQFGTFDGNGKTISGLSGTTLTSGNFGLFDGSGGTIKNLTLSNVNININISNSGSSYVSAIVASGLGNTIENCTVTGNINVSSSNSGASLLVGAITAYSSESKIEKCTVNGSIACTGAAFYVGGLVGLNSSQIKNSTNNATVTSNHTSNVKYSSHTGGIAGYTASLVSYCNNNGVITGNDLTGGIVGESYGGTISNCHTKANVKYTWKNISESNMAGGVAGLTHWTKIEFCSFTGVVQYLNPSSTSTTLQPMMGQIIGYSSYTTHKSNTGNGQVDKGTLQKIGNFDQALYAAQYGLYGKVFNAQ